MEALQVGLVGLGTVGTGLARILIEQTARIERRAGIPIRLKRIADLDWQRDRGVDLRGIALSDDAKEILEDPEISVMVELIGGIEPARSLLLEAMARKKHVVTANKALLASHGPTLFQRASEAGVEIGFEASVAGGIPIVRCLRDGLAGDQILSLTGIINGTANYILSTMTEQGRGFAESLKQAQELGFAEANPSLDVEGHDTAHKLSILIALAYGGHLSPEEIYTEGIQEIDAMDILHAGELGYRIKLLAIAKDLGGVLEARVHPTMVPVTHPLSSVGHAFNAIYLNGLSVGPVMFYGKGAGMMPTAGAVASDLIEIGRNQRLGIRRRVPPLGFWGENPEKAVARPMEDLTTRYYIRIPVVDRPGVLSRIAGALGACGISIHSVIQHGRRSAGPVHIIMLTHEAREASLRRAMASINRMEEVLGRTLFIRIEDAMDGF